MAVSGFEGFEKRIELNFSGDDPADTKGLRLLDFFSLEKVLHAVQCTVVSAVGNKFFDSYVLSESSLFVYPTKIIIKTCGTTQLLKSVRPLVDLAATIGLTPTGCRYTRGSFIFPEAQPYPHTSFQDEVFYLEQDLPGNLVSRKASVMNAGSRYTWHVFTARDDRDVVEDVRAEDIYTVEICMTELDRVLARKFFRQPGEEKTGDAAGKEMTDATGIGEVNRSALICDYAFDPCGYSMNGLARDRYSTVHVTPEDGFSYASFETVGSVHEDGRNELLRMLQKVIKIFGPGELSVSITTCGGTAAGGKVWRVVEEAVKPLGMMLRGRAADVFPEAGTVVFQTITRRQS